MPDGESPFLPILCERFIRHAIRGHTPLGNQSHKRLDAEWEVSSTPKHSQTNIFFLVVWSGLCLGVSIPRDLGIEVCQQSSSDRRLSAEFFRETPTKISFVGPMFVATRRQEHGGRDHLSSQEFSPIIGEIILALRVLSLPALYSAPIDRRVLLHGWCLVRRYTAALEET